MITVGVRDLKNQLSRYLQYVKNGEKVIITEHGKIVAEISIPQKAPDYSIEKKLEEWAGEGKVILSKRNAGLASMPGKTEPLDWKSIYESNRSDR